MSAAERGRSAPDAPRYKLGRLEDGEWTAHVHARLVRSPQPGDPVERLWAGMPGGDPAVFARLVGLLAPPCYLLYVLHTPRGEGEPGRYQSPPLSTEELRAFLAAFGAFLSSDARFDLWVHSPADEATVVWDRHDHFFAYGPLARLARELQALGYAPGEPTVPVPHAHRYWPEHDEVAAEVLRALDWSRSPLEPEDEQ